MAYQKPSVFSSNFKGRGIFSRLCKSLSFFSLKLSLSLNFLQGQGWFEASIRLFVVAESLHVSHSLFEAQFCNLT